MCYNTVHYAQSLHLSHLVTVTVMGEGLTSGVVTPGVGEPTGHPDGPQHSGSSLRDKRDREEDRGPHIGSGVKEKHTQLSVHRRRC